jgi:hypothetical protein
MQSSGNKFAVYKWGFLSGLLMVFLLSCAIVPTTPLPTEIEAAAVQAPVAVVESVEQPPPAEAEATPQPENASQPEAAPAEVAPTPTTYFMARFSSVMNTGNQARDEQALPYHGLFFAVVVPFIIIGIPWLIFEFFTIRYIQPRGIDLSTVRIKAQDGLFIQATVSMTVRRNLSIASARMTWAGVQSVMEKTVEQELIHEALQYPTLEDLERNIKHITEKFLDLPVLRELYRDFGVEVMRFNIESFYPQETMDALNRKAEASAGGAAYLAFAAAAHLDPDTKESRDLYRVYQQTTSRVDAYRNLGGGIAAVTNLVRREEKKDSEEEGKK